MNRFLLFFACCFLFSLTSCDEDGGTFVGSGNLITETRSLGGFQSVDVSSNIDVTITSGPFAVEVTTDSNLADRFMTEVSGGELRVFLRNGNYREATLRATITMPDLEGVGLSGASTAAVTGFAGMDDLRLGLSGASVLTATGSSAERLDVTASGASRVNGYELSVSEAEVTISGASTAQLSVSSALDGSVSGASTLRYRGTPTVDVDVTGSSTARGE